MKIIANKFQILSIIQLIACIKHYKLFVKDFRFINNNNSKNFPISIYLLKFNFRVGCMED